MSRSGYKTDPEGGHFLNQFNKVFIITASTSSDAQRNAAMAWASERYRVVGANVAVFIQATSEHDVKTRVEHMINRMTMNCDLNLYITKRDPEVS